MERVVRPRAHAAGAASGAPAVSVHVFAQTAKKG
jgi:hypothetical protein